MPPLVVVIPLVVVLKEANNLGYVLLYAILTNRRLLTTNIVSNIKHDILFGYVDHFKK